MIHFIYMFMMYGFVIHDLHRIRDKDQIHDLMIYIYIYIIRDIYMIHSIMNLMSRFCRD